MTDKENSPDYSDNNKLNLYSAEIPPANKLNAESAFKIYESLRPILPETKSIEPKILGSVSELLDEVDGLILDGYGIVNIGNNLTPGFQKFFSEISQRNLPFVFLTNGASQPSKKTAQTYNSWGLEISRHDIISSRDVLEEKLINKSEKNIMRLDEATAPLKHCLDFNHKVGIYYDALRQAEAFAFMGSIGWTDTKQSKLEAALRENPRTVFVANPDITAPQENRFSAEPGYWVARAMKQAEFPVEWYGKPYPASFQMAIKILQRKTTKALKKSRIAMIGDSLHTDILGANAAGLMSVLVTNYGLMRELNVLEICKRTSIYPHFIAPAL